MVTFVLLNFRVLASFHICEILNATDGYGDASPGFPLVNVLTFPRGLMDRGLKTAKLGCKTCPHNLRPLRPYFKLSLEGLKTERYN